jgi:hypothetical protein
VIVVNLNFDYFKVWGFPYKLWNVKTQSVGYQDPSVRWSLNEFSYSEKD